MIYLDDIVVYSNNSAKVWAKCVEVVSCLTSAGFMINVKKSDFLESMIKMLGFMVGDGKLCPCYE